MIPYALKCEHLHNPRGIQATCPRLSWALRGEGRGRHQTAYEIRVASSPDALQAGRDLMWNSGRTASAETLLIPYGGRPLRSGERCYWMVRAVDETGAVGAWSAPAFWEMGILDPAEWCARWISLSMPPTGGYTPPRKDLLDALHVNDFGGLPALYLRRRFHLDRPLARATLYATARGLYHGYVNGNTVAGDLFEPGWTDYHTRLHYRTYDVTDLIDIGENIIGIVLGEGWYSGRVAEHRKYPAGHYGSQPWFLCQLHLEYQDGSMGWIASDDAWRAYHGPIVWSDLVNGETCDARQTLGAWTEPAYDDANWRVVTVRERGPEMLHGAPHQPLRVTEERAPVSWRRNATGAYIADFGQNMVGVVRLRTRAPAGTVITLRHGEMLDSAGALYTANLSGARQTDCYICIGQVEESWQPSFTLHGFRYLEIHGLVEEPKLDTLTALVIHSDLPRAGEVSCSSALVTALQRNICWSLRGNFTDIPTDCPQRDERLGWLGDAQLFAGTAAYNYDVAAFFTKWMADIADAQRDDGAFPDMAPMIRPAFDCFAAGAPGWGDAGVIIPWTMYHRYGDVGLIRQHYAAMCRWMNYVEQHNPDHLRRHALGNNFGDWLAIDNRTDKTLLASAYYAWTAKLMADMAEAIDAVADAERYHALHAAIKEAFLCAFVAADGRIAEGTQTAYALAIAFDLLPEPQRRRAGDYLAEEIEMWNGRLSTGFHGTRFLCAALCETGHAKIAYDLILEERYPSWGYMINQGATTLWERWDSVRNDHGFQSPTMNSFNHYGLGSIGEWLFEYMAGIRCLEPGFRHVGIMPTVDRRVRWARAEHQAHRGTIAAAWQWLEHGLSVSTTIPPNTRATVVLPCHPGQRVLESGQPLAASQSIFDIQSNSTSICCALGSGDYHFMVLEPA